MAYSSLSCANLHQGSRWYYYLLVNENVLILAIRTRRHLVYYKYLYSKNTVLRAFHCSGKLDSKCGTCIELYLIDNIVNIYSSPCIRLLNITLSDNQRFFLESSYTFRDSHYRVLPHTFPYMYSTKGRWPPYEVSVSFLWFQEYIPLCTQQKNY